MTLDGLWRKDDYFKMRAVNVDDGVHIFCMASFNFFGKTGTQWVYVVGSVVILLHKGELGNSNSIASLSVIEKENSWN